MRAMYDGIVTGNHNLAMGYLSLENLTGGIGNIALGREALETLTVGNNNVAVGNFSLEVVNSSENTAVGNYSGQNNTTTDQVFIGYEAGQSTTSGAGQTFVGHSAGKGTGTALTGTNNTAVGRDSGLVLQGNAYSNTFYGANSGGGVTTGDENTYIGNDAGVLMTSGSQNTILGAFDGNQDDLDIRTSSNNIVLSDGGGNPRVHIDSAGDIRTGAFSITGASEGFYYQPFYGITWSSRNSTASQNHRYFVNPNGPVGSISTSGSATAYNTSSDYRLKENVVYDWDATTRLKQLKPARFNFIADADTTVDGFLAHEAQEVVPECVTGTKDAVDADGVAVMQGIDQSKLVPLLVKTIQELEARITALEGA
jgi:hypothetical protein